MYSLKLANYVGKAGIKVNIVMDTTYVTSMELASYL